MTAGRPAGRFGHFEVANRQTGVMELTQNRPHWLKPTTGPVHRANPRGMGGAEDQGPHPTGDTRLSHGDPAMFSKHDQIQGYDDELFAAMQAEDARQEDHLELIASENYTSQRVMQA